MKSKILLLILLMNGIIGIYAQHNHKCNHKRSFEKSWLSDTLDAQSYTIYLEEFDFANQSITAHTEVMLESKVDNLNAIKLELKDLIVDDVTVNGQPFNFSHNGELISIPLSGTINSGDQILVDIAYHGEPFHEAWGGFHWSGDYCFNLGVGFVSIPHNLGKTWFPCIDDFQDRAFYTIYATVDEEKDAVCGGLLEEVIDNGNGTRTFKWAMQNSIPTYLASIAVGDYARWTDTYNGINGEIPIEIWVKPADSNKVDGSFEHLNEILAIYEEHFGPYRFERVGYVGTAIGAMEHATNIAYPHFSINGNLGSESLLAHELAHMWFGDNITCASAEDMWINEGWATFIDGIYQEFLYSREQYLNFIITKHKGVIQYCHTSSGLGAYYPLNQTPQEYTYDNIGVYDRGAITAHTLRGYLGDEIFFDAMAAFNEQYKFSPVSSYDMRDFLTTHTGIEMTDWFDNWVFNSGTPHYSIDSFSVVPNGNAADVNVFMKQKRHGPEFIGNANKIELTFMDNNWNQYSDVMEFDGETGSMVFSVPFIPELVLVDLHKLACDAITEYSMSVKETGEINFGDCFFKLDVQNVSDSAFVRVEHNWAPPDELKNPVQGLTISPYRYWKIDGIIPEDFNATGIFMYNKNAFLDDGLITSDADSVVILYRQNTADDWQFIDFTQIGIWSIGNLYIDNLQTGEYTLGVCDDTFVGIGKNTINSKRLNVFPNPSERSFRIDTEQPGTLNFYDITGKSIDTIVVTSNTKYAIWEPENLPEGTYFVRYLSEKNITLGVEKLILVKNM